VLLLNPPGPFCRAGSRWPHSRKPSATGIDYHPFPFGLAYAASRLETDGHEARLVDCIALGTTREELLQIAADFGPDRAFMETSTPSFHADVATMRELGIPCVAGGPHATATWAEHVEAGFAGVICGEYDQGISQAIGLEPMPWLALPDHRPAAHAPLTEDLDAIAHPAWGQLPMEKYNDPICRGRSVTVLSSRGCPHGCGFCTLAPFHGRRDYRLRDPAAVCDEIGLLIEQYGPDEVYFDDDTITVNPKHVLGLCAEYSRRGFGLPFACMGHATAPRDVIEAMAAAGCRAYKFGVESADPEVLDQIPKALGLDDVVRTVRDCHDLGIQTHATYLLGLPGEDRDSALRTIDFALGLDTHTLQFAIATPYPGTALYERAKEAGWLTGALGGFRPGGGGRPLVSGLHGGGHCGDARPGLAAMAAPYAAPQAGHVVPPLSQRLPARGSQRRAAFGTLRPRQARAVQGGGPMRVALINPSVPLALRKENLGLAYLAAGLEAAGHEACIIDEVAGQDVDEGLDAFRPDVAGISFMTMYAVRAYALADRIRGQRGVPVVLGGAHPTALPKEALEHGDCVLRGEGEAALPRLLTEGRIEGVVEGAPAADLDGLPLPKRAALDLEFYASSGDEIAGLSYRTLGVITSRGCPYRCDFCLNSRRATPLRFHSPERVVEEIRYLAERHGIEAVAFYDELMAADAQRFAAICEAMLAAGLERLRWECQAHPRVIRPEMLALMKRAGCVQVAIGFESGSQAMLDRIHKKTRVEANLETARRVKEAGLRLRGCFVIGVPGETAEDVGKTERFIRDGGVDFASIHFLTPYPGTALYEQYEDEIRAQGASWEQFTTGNPDAFACNDAMPASEQKRIYENLCARQAFRNYSWRDMARRALRDPRHALHVAAKLLR